MLFCHGWPESWYSWRHQLTAVSAAGFRCVAPDMRGYGGTDKSGPFDVRTLAKDVAGLVAALGRERAAIVGHDWGGGVAWATAHLEPQVVGRLAILNCPHPGAMMREIFTRPLRIR